MDELVRPVGGAEPQDHECHGGRDVPALEAGREESPEDEAGGNDRQDGHIEPVFHEFRLLRLGRQLAGTDKAGGEADDHGVLLALTLRRHDEAVRWGTVWVGFGIALTAWLAVTAWAVWRRRQFVIVAALFSATLLLTDVWFDVMTAAPRNDLLVSIASAVFGNIPLAMLLAVVAYRLIMATAHNARRMAGDDRVDVPLRKLPIFAVDKVSLDG